MNLVNLEFLNGNYEKTAVQLEDLLSILESRGREDSHGAFVINLNLSRCYYALAQYGEADSYYQIAYKLDAGEAESFSYLASVSATDGVSRAADASENTILFLDEE